MTDTASSSVSESRADVLTFQPTTSHLHDFSRAAYPSQLLGWSGGTLQLAAPRDNPAADTTHYGFIASGNARLSIPGKSGGVSDFELSAGMFFSVPGDASIKGTGNGFIATRLRYRGLFQVGGPIESTGRLRYIDGCSDTMLIGPPVLGDPCLNLLHIPPGTNQTSHTHPTERLGMIAAGHGECWTPTGKIALSPGLIFAIESEGVHSFNTQEESLLVIAWHPDSDCGPSHKDHPMINRTIVDGTSAAKLDL